MPDHPGGVDSVGLTKPGPDDEVIWHYTAQDTFVSIVENASLRFSDIECMNDPTERQHLVDLTRAEIEQRLGQAKVANDEPAIILFTALKRFAREFQLPIYVGSFSAARNDLSQWRAYSGSELGYAIGFRQEGLIKAIKDIVSSPKGGKVWSRKITYADVDKLNSIRTYFDGRLNHARRLWSEYNDVKRYSDHITNIADSLPYHLSDAAQVAFAKDSSFSPESKFRIAIQMPRQGDLNDNAKIGFRSCHGVIRPHLEFSFSRDVFVGIVSEVLVWPAKDGELSVRKAQLFMEHFGFGRGVVVASKIPYRK